MQILVVNAAALIVFASAEWLNLGLTIEETSLLQTSRTFIIGGNARNASFRGWVDQVEQRTRHTNYAETSKLIMNKIHAPARIKLHALQLEDTALHGLTVRPHWSLPLSSIWQDAQCSNLGNHANMNLAWCQDLCEDAYTCNAINYSPASDDCILRACPHPIPQPTLSKPGYFGYHLQARSATDLGPSLHDTNTSEAPVAKGSFGRFQCHDYVHGEDDEWCRNRSQKVVGGYEYLLVHEGSESYSPCGGCKCCKRPLLQPVIAPVISSPSPSLQSYMFGPWQCYVYARWQDDAWCQQQGQRIIAGYQYWLSGEFQVLPRCGGCWCCRRQLLSPR